MTSGAVRRTAVSALALLAGALLGTCVLFLHGYWWGLALGVTATIACLVAVPGGWWRRLPLAIGWDAAVLGLSFERPEGDYLVASDTLGYLLLASCVVVLCGGIIGLRRHPSAEPTITTGAGPPS